MENYPLTWLESKQKSKADTEENTTDLPPVEYQDYLNIKGDIFKNDLKEHITHLIHLSKGIFHNPICFFD
jgi:hypothetical protein